MYITANKKEAMNLKEQINKYLNFLKKSKNSIVKVYYKF